MKLSGSFERRFNMQLWQLGVETWIKEIWYKQNINRKNCVILHKQEYRYQKSIS